MLTKRKTREEIKEFNSNRASHAANCRWEQEHARKAEAGKENRMVDCQWTFNFLKMEKSLIREDTGEVVNTEKLTDTERQLALKTEYDFKLPLSEQGGKEATA